MDEYNKYEIQRRTTGICKSFDVAGPIMKLKKVQKRYKLGIYKISVRHVLLYRCETWSSMQVSRERREGR